MICLGLKLVASQMSLDLRGAGPEKASRGGMNTLMLGVTSVTTGRKGQGVSSAWPKPHSPLPLDHAWARGPRWEGLVLTWNRHVQILVFVAMVDFAYQVFI